MGWLRWTPDAFWGATLAEVTAGVMGYLEAEKGQARPGAKAGVFDGLLDMARKARREEIRAERRGS